MMKQTTLALGLLLLSGKVMAAPSAHGARVLQQASKTAYAAVKDIKEKCPNVGPNANDRYINDVLLPEIEDRLISGGDKFGEAAEILDGNPDDFQGQRVFRSGCVDTARAALKLGTAKLKAVDAQEFTPFDIEFEDIKTDIETARIDNGC